MGHNLLNNIGVLDPLQQRDLPNGSTWDSIIFLLELDLLEGNDLKNVSNYYSIKGQKSSRLCENLPNRNKSYFPDGPLCPIMVTWGQFK